MSYEVLLLAGEPSTLAREERGRLVAHAAAKVPGSVDWSIFENEHAILALVRTAPDGGTFARIDTASQEVRVGIGTSAQGVDFALAHRDVSQHCGAEAAHVKVILGANGEVEVDADGIGFVPSFWSAKQGKFWFGTHLASLVSLGVTANISDVGVLEYLTMLHPLQDNTILRDVTMLPPGGRLTVRAGEKPRLTVRRLYQPSATRLSDAAAIAQFGDAWSTVMRDMIERIGSARPALGLSGGLDSRAIAVECARQDFTPFTFTYGGLDTAEGHTAAQIADILQFNHAVIPVSPDRMLRGASNAVDLLDGSHSPAEMYELWFIDVLRSFTDVIINGIAGGPLWGDDKALGLISTETVLDAQLRRYRPELAKLRVFLDADVAREADEQLRLSLLDSMREWDMSSRADMVIFWKIYNRQVRWGNPLAGALRRSGLRIEAPFLDSRFLQVSAMLTPDQRRNGRLYLEAQRQLFPQTSAVPRDSDGNSPDHLDHVYWSGESSYFRQLRNLALRNPVSAGRRVTRQLAVEALNRAPNWKAADRIRHRTAARRSVFPADLWLQTSPIYRERLLALLESAPVLGVFSSSALERLAAGLRSGQVTDGALLIAKIGTLQAWANDYSHRESEYRAIT